MARPAKIPTPRFNLRAHDAEKDKDTPTLILLIFRYKGKRLVWSTGHKAKPRFWNQKKGRVTITVNNSQDSDINKDLNTISSLAVDIFKEYGYGKIAIEDFKTELDYRTGRKMRPAEETKNLPLFPFIEWYLEMRSSAANAKRGTWKIFKTAFNHLKKYAQDRDQELNYEDIDWNFRHDFLNWLYQPPREHSVNYAAKILSIVKQFMSEAFERGYHTNDIFKRKGWNVKKEKIKKVVLSFEELEAIYQLDLSDSPRLDKVRDLFLIGAFSGLRFSDFTRIKPEHIISEEGVEMIEIFTQKTDTQVVIPFHPILRAILEKHSYTSPKAISNQKMNDYLKELCQLAGITEKLIVKRTVGGKRIEEEREKWELVTTHTARRSFATNFYQLGFPAIELMQITGHATERQFRGYINIDKRENAKNMAKRIAVMMGKSQLRKVE